MPHIKMYLKADTKTQVEMYSNLLEGFTLLSRFSLTSLDCILPFSKVPGLVVDLLPLSFRNLKSNNFLR